MAWHPPISSRDPSLFLLSSLFAALKSAPKSLLGGLKPSFRPKPSLFSPIVRHPQANNAKPIPDSLFRSKQTSRFSSYMPYLSYQPYLSSRNPRLIPSSSQLASLSWVVRNLEVARISVELAAHPHPLATWQVFRAIAKLAVSFLLCLLCRLFRLFSQLRVFCVRKEPNINICLHIPLSWSGRRG